MINLNYSSSSNLVSVIPDSNVTISDNLLLDFTQSYDLSTKKNIEGTFVSQNTFLNFTISGSSLPTASGQYEANLYSTTRGFVGYVWKEVEDTWKTVDFTWANGGNDPNKLVKDKLILVTYGYINGTNTPIIVELADGDMSLVRYTEPILNPVYYNEPTQSNIYYYNSDSEIQYTSSNELGKYYTYNL